MGAKLSPHQVEIDLLADIMEGKAKSPVSGRDAIMASRVAEAALQSALTGVPVKIQAE